jgi:hypothetical protein
MADVRALLVLLAGLLIGLSPAAALAHDGVPHAQDESSAASGSLDRFLSPGCPPGPGHLCGCGNLSLCEGSAKPALPIRGSVSLVAPRASDVVAVHEATAWPSPQFPPSLPRAPPQVS